MMIKNSRNPHSTLGLYCFRCFYAEMFKEKGLHIYYQISCKIQEVNHAE